MIDQNLIENSRRHVQNSIDNAVSVWDKHLRRVNDCLDPDVIEKIKTYISQTSQEQWILVQRQETQNRRAINWAPDTVIEELHMIFETLTPSLIRYYNLPLNFHGIQLWRDGEGYYIREHTDNPIIDVSLQIYLFDAPLNLGTRFRLPDQQLIDIEFKHNTGYLSWNDPEGSITHSSTTVTPVGVSRYSLHAYWSVEPKRK